MKYRVIINFYWSSVTYYFNDVTAARNLRDQARKDGNTAYLHEKHESGIWLKLV